MTTTPATVRARALAARDALAPTFPIATFVAANPLHGLEHLSFEDAARHVAATTGAASFLSEEAYRELHRSGRITDAHLRTALLRRWPTAVGVATVDGAHLPPHDPADPDVELSLAALLEGDVPTEHARCVRTLTEATDLERGTRLADAVDAMVATWCAAYLDQGQASAPRPAGSWACTGPWRSLAPRDPAVRRLGGRAARRRVEGLPDDAASVVADLVGRWGLEEGRQVEYFRACYRRLPGWASRWPAPATPMTCSGSLPCGWSWRTSPWATSPGGNASPCLSGWATTTRSRTPAPSTACRSGRRRWSSPIGTTSWAGSTQ